MALEIEGYKYITHKLIPRPWGPECRFTVARLNDGYEFNEVIPIPSMMAEEKELVEKILARLILVDREPEPYIDPMQQAIEDAVSAKEAEIKAILVAKELLTAEQEIAEMKTKTEIIANSKVVGGKG